MDNVQVQPSNVVPQSSVVAPASVDDKKSLIEEVKILIKRRDFLYPILGDLVLTTANNLLYLVELLYLIQNGYNASDISFFLMCAMGAFGISLIIGGYIVDWLGFNRAMTLSLLIYACIPLVFFHFIENRGVLTIIALLSGFNSAIAHPAASVYTYSVIERKQLGRLFLPLYIISGIGWIGYYVGGWLLESNPLWAFGSSTVLVLVSIGLFNYGLQGSALTSLQKQESTRQLLMPHLAKFFNRKFGLLSMLVVAVISGSYIFGFVVPMSIIGTNEQNSQQAGILMSSAFALSMIISLIVNRVLHIKIEDIRYVLIGNTILSLLAAASQNSMIASIIVWAIFIVLSLQANTILFAQLWLFIDVKSGIEQGVFQSLSTITGFLAYLAITLFVDKIPLWWLFIGYAVFAFTCLVLAVQLSPTKSLVPNLGEVTEAVSAD